MKTAKLIIDGREVEVLLTDEQVEELTASEKVTGFERADSYLYIDSEGGIGLGYDEDDTNSDWRYGVANYYTDNALAQWCRRSDNLTHKMRRWAAEHNSRSFDWSDSREDAWHIAYNMARDSFDFQSSYHKHFVESVYFETEEIAEEAIKVFGDEIKWLAQTRPKWF